MESARHCGARDLNPRGYRLLPAIFASFERMPRYVRLPRALDRYGTMLGDLRACWDAT